MVVREESKMKKYSNGKYIEITEDEVFRNMTSAEPTTEERLAIMEDAFAELCEVIFGG